jgi:hypothetical protein
MRGRLILFNVLSSNRAVNAFKGVLGNVRNFVDRHPYASLGALGLGALGLGAGIVVGVENNAQRRRLSAIGYSPSAVDQIMSGIKSPSGVPRWKSIEWLREGGFSQKQAEDWVKNNLVYPK